MSSAAALSRPEALIRYLLEGTSSETGQEFFRALVHSVAMAMDVARVWVTEYLPERKVLRFLLPAIPNLLPSVLADGSLAPQPETDTNQFVEAGTTELGPSQVLARYRWELPTGNAACIRGCA